VGSDTTPRDKLAANYLAFAQLITSADVPTPSQAGNVKIQ
jgi:hypothetical protein